MQPEKKTVILTKLRFRLHSLMSITTQLSKNVENVETCEIKQYNWLQINNIGPVLSSTAT